VDSDVDLIRRALARDDRAFGELFDRHSTAVYRYAYSLTHDLVETQELVQETFVTAWRRLADLRLAGDSLLPWLIATCRNHALNLQRSRARTDVLPLDERVAARGATALVLEREEHAAELAWVLDAIQRLGEPDRSIVELCLYEGRSYKEAALALGLSVSAVSKRVERSRERLRRMRAVELEGEEER